MIWYEVIEDLGDGTSVARRFKTKLAAEKYVEDNIDYCYSGIDEVDTSDWKFFYDPYEEIIND